MPTGGNVGGELYLTGLVDRAELLKVYIVSWIDRKGYPSTANKLVSQPAERKKSWIEIFAVVQARIPKPGKKITKETRYFLGYIGDDSDLPTEVLVHKKRESLLRWDRAEWGEIKFDWCQITPFLSHSDPVLKLRAEKIDVVEHPKLNSFRNPSEKFCQYTNLVIKDKVWLEDTIEYKKSPINAQFWFSGKWGAKIDNYVGTMRYQVSVTCKNQIKDSPGRIIGKTDIESKSEQEACSEFGITPKDYKILKQVKLVDDKLLPFLRTLSPPPKKGLPEKEARQRLGSYKLKEQEACRIAGIGVGKYRILKSNLRIKDCSSKGIKPTVHRISIRSGNSCKYLSCLHAYVGVPWVFGSGGAPNPSNHQTELFQGFDCADFVVGGARAAGLTKIAYTTANALAGNRLTVPVVDEFLSAVTADSMVMKGDIVDPFESVLSIKKAKVKNSPEVDILFGIGRSKVQVGDLILFDWDANGKKFDHATVIVGNKQGSIKTKLDKETLIISAGYNRTCYDGKGLPQSGPLTETFEQLTRRHKAVWFKIRRWRKSAQQIYVLLTGFKPWGTLKWNPTQNIAEEMHGKTIDLGNIANRYKVNAAINSLVLPVSWYESADTVIEEIKREKYNIVISMGMNVFSDLHRIEDLDLKFQLESQAYNKNDLNEKDDRNEDVSGAVLKRELIPLGKKATRNQIHHTQDPEKVKDDGPDCLRSETPSGLPFSDIADAINARFPNAPIRRIIDPYGPKEIDYAAVKEKKKGFAFVNDEGSGDFVCNQINYNLLYYNLKDKREDRFQHHVMAGFVHVPSLDPQIYGKELLETVEIIVKISAKKYLEFCMSD